MAGIEEAMNTLKAGVFEITFARLFGKKSVGTDNGMVVTCSHWRGKSYVIDVKHSSAPNSEKN